ncbi:MAG: hypothetical protein JWR39_440 [Devosia sp.]|nr:hypothetical protein [Devosia sp.]
MNTANLQLEGLYLALAAVNRALVDAGVVSRDQLELAFRKTESVALGADRMSNLSPAERDAVCFPIRVLQVALEAPDADFADLARTVGTTKPRHNDQL